jgi:phage/plasmid-like protein (TIGR03299 family)
LKTIDKHDILKEKGGPKETVVVTIAARKKGIKMTTTTSKPFYASQEAPWAGLGTDVEQAMTWDEAVTTAGLDYDLELGDVLAGPDKVLMPNKRAVYRADTNLPLAVVGTSFRPVQRRDMAAFMDDLIADRSMRFLRSGELLNGLRAWFLATLDADIRVGRDVYIPYLVGTDCVDGSSALRLFPTFVNTSSNNSLSFALETANVSRFLIRHTGNVQTKLEAAKRALNITTNEMRRAKAWLDNLFATEIEEVHVSEVERLFLGDIDEASTRTRKAIDLFRAIYSEEVGRNGENGYALLSATIGYADHGVTVRGSDNPENRMLSSYFGGIARTKRAAIEAISDTLAIKY